MIWILSLTPNTCMYIRIATYESTRTFTGHSLLWKYTNINKIHNRCMKILPKQMFEYFLSVCRSSDSFQTSLTLEFRNKCRWNFKMFRTCNARNIFIQDVSTILSRVRAHMYEKANSVRHYARCRREIKANSQRTSKHDTMYRGREAHERFDHAEDMLRTLRTYIYNVSCRNKRWRTSLEERSKMPSINPLSLANNRRAGDALLSADNIYRRGHRDHKSPDGNGYKDLPAPHFQ